MKNTTTRDFKRLILLAFGFLFVSSLAFAQNYNSPVGYWKQFSDTDGKLHSIVKIYKAGNELKGKIVAGFRLNGKLPKQYCTGCPGHFKNKQLLGMDFIWGMHYANGRWSGGHILDPDNGDVYKANMVLTDGGQKLHVRGYIMISLFGRTQVWVRIPKDKVKAELAKGLTKVIKTDKK